MIGFVARHGAAFALAAAVISSPAYCLVDDDARSVVVKTADLNLTSEAGRTTLNRRIAYAARTVCGRPDALDLVATRLANGCRTAAVANAMPLVQLALAKAARGERLAANAVSVKAFAS